MGERAKWLQDERYIRIAGAMLMVSPFLNYFTSIAFSSNIPDRWSLKQLIVGFMIASGFSWLGRISNFVVGFLMFRGKSSAWVPVLAILGFTIGKNIITFKGDFQINRIQTLGGLVINILLFLLVFESEYRINKEINKRIKASKIQRTKQDLAADIVAMPKSYVSERLPPENSPTSEPKFQNKKLLKKSQSQSQSQSQIKNRIEPQSQTKSIPNGKKTTPFSSKISPQSDQLKRKLNPKNEFVVKKGSAIDFDGMGKFAEVFHCTENELWLKITNHMPSDIHKKIVTLQMPGNKAQIRLKFSRMNEDSTAIFRVIA